MERLKVWLNQQIAKILGDLHEQEPVEHPSPTRAGCRIFFIMGLLLGFSLLLVYNFIDAPDARVVQIDHLTPEDKNYAFPSCFLYVDRNSTNCTKWSKSKFPLGIPVSCPCTNTSVPWKNFVKFHVLHENSTDWQMSFVTKKSLRYIDVPDDPIRLGNENIVKDTEVLTAEKFCNLSYLWPHAIDSTPSSGSVLDEDLMSKTTCVWMATLLFNGPIEVFEDRTRSTQFLSTPSLLNREEFNTLLARLARESVLSRRLILDMALSVRGNEIHRRFYNALARHLKGLLDRKEMDPSHSYIYGAKKLSDILSTNRFYDENVTVWYLRDDSGLIFLQPETDWEAYRQTCSPEYCEVTMPMGGAWKLFWALGILGGVATIVLTVVTTLLWPCTAMLLLWISERKTAEKRGPGTPQGALVAGPQPVELSSSLDSKILSPKTLDSKPQPAEGALDELIVKCVQ